MFFILMLFYYKIDKRDKNHKKEMSTLYNSVFFF